MTTRPILLPFLVLLWLSPAQTVAQEERVGVDRSNTNAPADEPWKELATKLPGYPKPDNLVALQSSYFDGSYEYLIDTAALLVDADGIARYSVVIRKPGGSRQHVIHEGLRCATRAVRIYGMASGASLVARESEWEPLALAGPYVYRRALYESVLCSEEGGALPAEHIKARLAGDADAGLLGGSNSYYTGRR